MRVKVEECRMGGRYSSGDWQESAVEEEERKYEPFVSSTALRPRWAAQVLEVL